MTDLPFDYDPRPAEPDDRAPRKCSHPKWRRVGLECGSCGHLFTVEAQTRGRTNRSRGNAIEREVGKRLGLRRIGHFGGATDLISEPFAVSVKSGSGYFSERYWDQLRRQPVQAGQTPLLVVTDAPGPGIRRRAMVVLDIESWIELHGPVPA